MIRFLKNSEIDRNKWDTCIKDSQQGFIYGMSWYLDLVSPGWCGLEEDDYSKVMPLPVKRKYGVNYIIHPYYAQQLGLYSKSKISTDKTNEFLLAIPSSYKYISLNLNYGNDYNSGFGFQKLNNNYELRLSREYAEIASEFSANTRRNIQKTSGIKVLFDGNIDELIRLKDENTGANRRRISPEFLKQYLTAVYGKGAGFICRAVSDNKTCASVFFLQDQKRIYYLIPVSDPVGKDKKAMFAIIDAVIKKFTGSPLVLDFEGSNIPGLARFFEGFAAVNNPYPSIKINRLPFPLNLLRKS
jgi:hypothetical protein